MSLKIFHFKPYWDGFSHCLIANFISRSCGTKSTAYLYMVSKKKFFKLTGIFLNYDRLLTLLHISIVVTCKSILLNTKHTKEWKWNNSQYALTSIQYCKDVFNSESTRHEKPFPPLSLTHVLTLDGTHLNKYLLSAQNFACLV